MLVLDQGSVSLEWVTPNPARVVTRAGRTCYRSADEPSEDSSFVRKLIRRKHHSVLEHAVASFRIITDRGITHELVRHRIASFSQESTRYCNYSGTRFEGQIQFIKPVGITVEQHEIWLEAMANAESSYMKMLAAGAKPQLARSVLPNSTRTEIVMTANLREWRTVLALRLDPAAHPDMIVIMELVAEILLAEAPDFFPEIVDFDDEIAADQIEERTGIAPQLGAPVEESGCCGNCTCGKESKDS